MAQETKMTSSPRKAVSTTDEFVLVALGGMGEIGMNAYLYGYGPPTARRSGNARSLPKTTRWLPVQSRAPDPHAL